MENISQLIPVYQSCLLLIGAYMFFLFALAWLKKDNGIVDIAWGMGFILITLYTLFKHSSFFPRQVFISTMIVVWGLRLSVYIFTRNIGKTEDFRYANWRKQWGELATIRAFFQVFILQGFLMCLIALPIIHVNTYNVYSVVNWIDILGFGIFLFGLIFESVADSQLLSFKRKKGNKGKIMKLGLWQYSRHPNYFGECVLWWGIFLVATQVHFMKISIISPLLINFLILFVSGIPMLEKKYKNNKTYQAYAKKTSIFFPRSRK